MIHPEGKPFILTPLILSGLSLIFRKKKLGLGLLGLSLAGAYFFRNPTREAVLDTDLIVAPADGKIVCCQIERRGELYDKPLFRIGIFMRLWDVHINRSPVTGKLLRRIHLAGDKGPVFGDDVLDKNERMVYLIEREDGTPFWVVQIAGLVARRIKSFVLPGDDLVTGDPIGLIKLGSRVELFFPAEGAQLFTKVGHKVFAGETVIGRLPLKS